MNENKKITWTTITIPCNPYVGLQTIKFHDFEDEEITYCFKTSLYYYIHVNEKQHQFWKNLKIKY